MFSILQSSKVSILCLSMYRLGYKFKILLLIRSAWHFILYHTFSCLLSQRHSLLVSHRYVEDSHFKTSLLNFWRAWWSAAHTPCVTVTSGLCNWESLLLFPIKVAIITDNTTEHKFLCSDSKLFRLFQL
jgi:hypothetical protein